MRSLFFKFTICKTFYERSVDSPIRHYGRVFDRYNWPIKCVWPKCVSKKDQMPGRLPTWGRIEVSNVPTHYVFISPLRSNTFCQMNFSTFQLKINEFFPSRCFFSLSRLSINKRDCDNGVLTVLLLANYDITVIGIICKEITWGAPCKNLFPFRRGCFCIELFNLTLMVKVRLGPFAVQFSAGF